MQFDAYIVLSCHQQNCYIFANIDEYNLLTSFYHLCFQFNLFFNNFFVTFIFSLPNTHLLTWLNSYQWNRYFHVDFDTMNYHFLFYIPEYLSFTYLQFRKKKLKHLLMKIFVHPIQVKGSFYVHLKDVHHLEKN